MKVVIAEKPSVAREIAAVLGANTKENGCLSGNGYKVTWAYGHLIGLVQAKEYGWDKWDKALLPMIPEKFKTAPIGNDVKAQLKIISDLFKQADMIINATDAGREGELIFRYIYEYLQERDGIHTPFSRLWISSLTDKAIKEGFADIRPGCDFDRVADAAKARSHADWLVGINATVATTLNVGHGTGVWSVGRVQTPTLAMICRRFIANRDFVPTPYYMLQIVVDKEGKQFKANHATKFEKKEDAETAINTIRKFREMQVLNVETKPSRQLPPLLYDLTTLQKEANSRFSYSADKTLEIAQSLYEKKLTSYPRTGSRYIPDDVYDLLPALIANAETYPRFSEYAKGLRNARLGKVSVNATKVTDHHALLPTEKCPTQAELDKLSKEERNIYEMILGRMLETVSEPCLKDVTTVTLIAPGHNELPFTAKGYIVRQAGWRAVMNLKEEKKEDEEEADLPPLSQGDLLALIASDVLSKQTKAPALLTENTLLGMMEVAGKELEDEEQREAMKEIGLGTPATRAAIIENLIAKGYVLREKKNLIPTEKGMALFEVVKDMRISNAEVTGSWEKKLNLICEGKTKVDEFNKEILDYTREITKELVSSSINTAGIKIPGQTNCPCPKCQKQHVKFSTKGYAYCPDKECKFIIPTTVFGKKLDERTIIKLITQGETKTIKGFKSKSGKKFDCAIKLSPDYKIVLALPDQGENRTFNGICPACGKETLQINDAKLWCGSCAFTVWRDKGGDVLTNEELQKLIIDKTTDIITGLTSQKGKTYDAYVILDKELKAVLKFPEARTTDRVCPVCKIQGCMTDNGKKLECSCSFTFWKSFCGHEFTDAEIETLFEYKSLQLFGLRKKSGQPFDAEVKLDNEGKLVFANSESSNKGNFPTTPVNHACPKCGKTDSLNKNGKKITCSCGFSMWLEHCKHVLTEKEIETILNKQKTPFISGLIGKTGKPFKARLFLKKDLSGIDMEFEKKK